MTTKETLRDRWLNKRITEAMLNIYVKKGVITEKDLKEIKKK